MEVDVDCSAVNRVGEFSGRAVEPGGEGVSETAVRISGLEGDAKLDVAAAGRTVKVRGACSAVAVGELAVPIPGKVQAADEYSRMDRNAMIFRKATRPVMVTRNEELRLLRKRARNDISYRSSCQYFKSHSKRIVVLRHFGTN
ncbi:MAG: hypothetical protein A2Z16_06950 [Chloroflexi bacterium RBG_16_54_18]|nr:MAG: hypothetical protein A2Z16_06950 [Chloroflexi bacterium RBG_16_54_18]